MSEPVGITEVAPDEFEEIRELQFSVSEAVGYSAYVDTVETAAVAAGRLGEAYERLATKLKKAANDAAEAADDDAEDVDILVPAQKEEE